MVSWESIVWKLFWNSEEFDEVLFISITTTLSINYYLGNEILCMSMVNSKSFAIGSSDGTLKVLDYKQKREIRSYRPHKGKEYKLIEY